jgi:hypothetical protein
LTALFGAELDMFFVSWLRFDRFGNGNLFAHLGPISRKPSNQLDSLP